MFRVLLVGWDIVGWAIALAVATALRDDLTLSDLTGGPLVGIMVVAAVAQVVIGLTLQTYRGRHPVGTVDEAVNITATTGLVGVVIFLVDFFVQPNPVPLSVPLLAVSGAVLLAASSRLAVRLYREHRYRADYSHARRVMIYGSGIEGQQLLRLMLSDPAGDYLPVALLDDAHERSRRRISGVAVAGTRADIASAAARSQADLLVIADRTLPADDIREIARVATDAGLGVTMVPTLPELLRPLPASLLVPAPRVADLDGLDDFDPFADVVPADAVASTPVESRTKRALDVVLALGSVLVLLPLLLLIAVTLKVVDGQVIYRARRIGRDGEPFMMLKFATMRPDNAGLRVTAEGDPRITQLGGWLRTSKLNELPQIFNVIKGDMSLVGPRPEDPQYTATYSEQQRRVLDVRPGMTSSAFLRFGDEQAYIERAHPTDVEAFYLEELLPEKLEIELDYIRNWSLREDLRIIATTARRLLL